MSKAAEANKKEEFQFFLKTDAAVATKEQAAADEKKEDAAKEAAAEPKDAATLVVAADDVDGTGQQWCRPANIICTEEEVAQQKAAEEEEKDAQARDMAEAAKAKADTAMFVAEKPQRKAAGPDERLLVVHASDGTRYRMAFTWHEEWAHWVNAKLGFALYDATKRQRYRSVPSVVPKAGCKKDLADPKLAAVIQRLFGIGHSPYVRDWLKNFVRAGPLRSDTAGEVYIYTRVADVQEFHAG